jgi:hypothetical protein
MEATTVARRLIRRGLRAVADTLDALDSGFTKEERKGIDDLADSTAGLREAVDDMLARRRPRGPGDDCA